LNLKIKNNKNKNKMSKRILEISTLKSIIIKSLFEVIKPYIKETNILINNEGLKISTMDTSKVSLTYIKLKAEKFEKYYCEKPIVIGIDTSTLFKVIKYCNRRETITFYMTESEPDKLSIELSDPFMGKVKDYKIPLLALDDKIANIQSMEFDYIINIPSVQFQQIIKDIYLLDGKIVEIKSLGRQIIFNCTDGIADFKTSISEVDEKMNKEQKMLLQQNGEDIKCIKFQKSNEKIVQGKFKLNYLMNFIKASHLCENMNILLTNDKPLVLEYFIADLGILRCLLAQEV
jgi:proliferating cell nuclear antigen